MANETTMSPAQTCSHSNTRWIKTLPTIHQNPNEYRVHHLCFECPALFEDISYREAVLRDDVDILERAEAGAWTWGRALELGRRFPNVGLTYSLMAAWGKDSRGGKTEEQLTK